MIDIQIQRKTKSSSFQRKTNFLLLQTFVLYFGRGHDIENYHKGLISKRTFICFVLKVISMITGRINAVNVLYKVLQKYAEMYSYYVISRICLSLEQR